MLWEWSGLTALSIQTPALAWTVTVSLMVMMLSSEMCESGIILTGGRVTQLREIEIQIVPN